MAFDEYKGAMFGTKWKTSARKYGVFAEQDVKIPMSDGTGLNANVWKPKSEDPAERFPAIQPSATLGAACRQAGGRMFRPPFSAPCLIAPFRR
jgi:hypothetical protein